jgi:hypothetical protein
LFILVHPTYFDPTNVSDNAVLDVLSNQLGPTATEVILRHPDPSLFNLMMSGLSNNSWIIMRQLQFAGISTKYRERLSGFVTTEAGVPLAYFHQIGYSSTKNDKSTLHGLLRCYNSRQFSGDAIRQAGAEGLLIANGLLRNRQVNANDYATGRSFIEYVETLNRDSSNIRALDSALEHSLAMSNAKSSLNASHGSVKISCHITFFDQAVEVAGGMYERTFTSLGSSQVPLHG